MEAIEMDDVKGFDEQDSGGATLRRHVTKLQAQSNPVITRSALHDKLKHNDKYTEKEIKYILDRLFEGRTTVLLSEIVHLLPEEEEATVKGFMLFLKATVCILVYPIVMLWIFKAYFKHDKAAREKMARAANIFVECDRATVLDKKRNWLLLNAALLAVANVTQLLALVFGLSRFHDYWKNCDAPCDTFEAFQHGNYVEMIFPFLIYGYFAVQIGASYAFLAVYDKKEEDKQKEMQNLHKSMEFTALGHINRDSAYHKLPFVQSDDQECPSCKLIHPKESGKSSDLYYHLFTELNAGVSEHSIWRSNLVYIFGSVAALILALMPMIIRLATQGEYAGGEAPSGDKDPRDYIIVFLSQVSLWSCFTVYWWQCYFVMYKFQISHNYMFFFSEMMEKDEQTASFTFRDQIMFMPHVNINLPDNLVAWYLLRSYIKMKHKVTTKLMEAVVGIMVAALATFGIILAIIIALGMSGLVKDVHFSTTGLQAESIIVVGCLLIGSYAVLVLMSGLWYNQLLISHVLFLAEAQVQSLKEKYQASLFSKGDGDSPRKSMSRSKWNEDIVAAITVVDKVKELLERDDKLFSLYGFPLDSSMVHRLQAAITSLVVFGISTTLTFLRQSFTG